MKKVILAALAVLAMSVGSAYAGQYAGLTYGSGNNSQLANQNSSYGILTYGVTMDQLDVEGRVGTLWVTNPNVTTDSAEVRSRFNFAEVYSVKPWLRGTLGETFNNGTNVSYYAVAPGVGYDVFSSLRVDAYVERTQMFDTAYNTSNHTNYAGVVSYAMSKEDSVSVTYSTSTDGFKPTTVDMYVQHRF